MIYLTVEQILFIQDAALRRFGGGHGLRDMGLLLSALERPKATFGGEDLYPDLPAKASALLESLVLNHPFVDGNKRTAAIAVGLFAQLNGQDLDAREGEIADCVLAFVEGRKDREALTRWIRARLRPRT